MRDIEIDAQSLRQGKVNIGRSAEDTDAALSAFIGRLESYGEPWGDDDLGSLIGLSYQGIFAAVMDCFESNLNMIDEYADRLGRAADETERADLTNAARVEQSGAAAPDLPL